MPGLFTLPDTLDIDRLRQALVQLVQEEELLRTGFVLDDGEIRMQVHDKVAFNVEIIEAGPDWDPATLIRPMDLARPPLFSAAFIHRKEGWALGLDMHHLISDGLTDAVTAFASRSALSGTCLQLAGAHLQRRGLGDAGWPCGS